MKKTFTLLLTLVAATPLIASAQLPQTLITIPGAGGGFDGYINAVYAMFISIAALLAVVKVIVAGVKYMFSDVVTQKSEAKKDIQGALLGLVVVLAAVLILTVINPNLTKFDLNGITKTPRAQTFSGPNGTPTASDKLNQCMRTGNCKIESCPIVTAYTGGGIKSGGSGSTAVQTPNCLSKKTACEARSGTSIDLGKNHACQGANKWMKAYKCSDYQNSTYPIGCTGAIEQCKTDGGTPNTVTSGFDIKCN